MKLQYNFDLLVIASLAMLVLLGLRRLLDLPTRLPRWNRALSWLWVPAAVGFAAAAPFQYRDKIFGEGYALFAYALLFSTLLRLSRYRPARTVLLAVLPAVLGSVIKIGANLGWYTLLPAYSGYLKTWGKLANFFMLALLLIARTQKRNLAKQQVQREKEEQTRQLIAAQNAKLEQLVAERTAALTQQATALQEAMNELKTTQAHLIQSEKMASLGELTAGIAHEIQNPLNFVTNFSEVSAELLDELAAEQAKPTPDAGLEAELLEDLTQNLTKITQHGRRAASIVRGMLEHSRASTGERVLTDLNALADEYLRLAYHGLRAKDKSFNATLQTDFAPVLPLVEAVSQDVGRVLLNLFTNAFYAVQQRQQASGEAGYVPTVGVVTERVGEWVEVRVRDNGVGMGAGVQQKIFQPFFTTKPAGQGTGLGLSLAHDIITQGHGGTLSVSSQAGVGTEFTVRLPLWNEGDAR
jgi:two-component system NtrC family sensor kinase